MTKLIFIGPMNLSIPSEKGAVEEIIWQISSRLKKYNYEVLIYNPLSNTEIQKIINGINLRLSLTDNDVIVHSHNLYATLPLINHKDRVFLTLHYPPWVTKSYARFKALIHILRHLDKSGIRLVSCSLAIKEYLNLNGVTSIYVPNGVDTQMFNPKKRNDEIREKLLEEKDFLILNVGRLHPTKNQIDLLKATRLMLRERRDFKIILIGPLGHFHKQEYSYYILLKEYIKRYGLENYITLLGEITHKEDLAKIYASSDIYVHVSKIEAAAPLAILEAMASGLPIVAYDMIFYKGYLRNDDNGILIPPGNIKKLSDMLLNLLNDKGFREKLGMRGRLYAEQIFSWDVIVKNYYLNLYK